MWRSDICYMHERMIRNLMTRDRQGTDSAIHVQVFCDYTGMTQLMAVCEDFQRWSYVATYHYLSLSLQEVRVLIVNDSHWKLGRRERMMFCLAVIRTVRGKVIVKKMTTGLPGRHGEAVAAWYWHITDGISCLRYEITGRNLGKKSSRLLVWIEWTVIDRWRESRRDVI